MNLKISIITVAFNSEATIEDTIKSVLSQKYCDLEYIIIDGGSTDKTVQIIKSYEEDFPIRWISEGDNGLYNAMNKGIRMATGDIVGILNSDDFYHRNDAISNIAMAFNKYKTESLFADLVFVEPNNLKKVVRKYSSQRFTPSRFKYGYMPAHPTFFTYKKNFLKFGFYKEDYKIAADFELLLRFLLIHKISYKHLPINLLTMRTGGASTKSLRSKVKINREFLRACDENKIKTNLLFICMKYFSKISEFEIIRKVMNVISIK